MRLTYEKYKGLDNIITIDLRNGFSVIAISPPNKTDGEYVVELHLKDNQISDWKLIEEAENLVFKTDSKRINSAILKQVAKFLEEGFFDKYIERYEYETKCFDIGNEQMEKERLGEKSSKPIKSKAAYRTYYNCSECDGDLGDEDTERYPYCPYCKVSLDWSDIEK